MVLRKWTEECFLFTGIVTHPPEIKTAFLHFVPQYFQGKRFPENSEQISTLAHPFLFLSLFALQRIILLQSSFWKWSQTSGSITAKLSLRKCNTVNLVDLSLQSCNSLMIFHFLDQSCLNNLFKRTWVNYARQHYISFFKAQTLQTCTWSFSLTLPWTPTQQLDPGWPLRQSLLHISLFINLPITTCPTPSQ